MSKKNKALKQLLKAQMQSNASAISQGKDLSSQQTQPSVNPSGATISHSQPIIADKQTAEFALIKKDISLSIILISLVIICLFVIYFIDKSNPFLLNLANQIFKLISK